MNLLQHLKQEQLQHLTRRHFLKDCSTGLGGMWLASQGLAQAAGKLHIEHDPSNPLAALAPTFAPKAKRVIYLHMVGAPSQLELFDYKPVLAKYDGKECPQEYLEGQRFAFIQGVPKMLGPQYDFKQHGQSGAWISDRLPELTKHADKLCFVKTMQTDQFNHGPAQLVVHTGNQNLGHPAMGSCVSWGLGTENQDLPGFLTINPVSGLGGAQNYGSSFLPAAYQGTKIDPRVLYRTLVFGRNKCIGYEGRDFAVLDARAIHLPKTTNDGIFFDAFFGEDQGRLQFWWVV